jgi:OmpA-OmpF porin, OOP family
MKTARVPRIASLATTSLIAILSLDGFAFAQNTEVRGVIDGRSGATMTVKSQESGSDVVVLLTDSTQVEEVEGGLHMRKKQMGMTALVLGLPVQVKGSSNDQNELVADTVKFKGSDLKTA